MYLSLQEVNTITDCMKMNEEGKFSVEDLFEILNTY